MLLPPRSVTRFREGQLARLRVRSTGLIVETWRTGDLAATVDMVLASQRAMVAVTDSGLSFAAGVTTGSSTSPIGLDPERLIGARARGGVSLEEVYSRPGKVVRESGFERGLAYLRSTAQTDLQLAHRRAAHAHAVADTRVSAWRRSPGGVAPCGLCVVASMRTYRRGDLMPLHNACQCNVTEVFSDRRIEQGEWVDRDALQSVYDSTGYASGGDLHDVRFDVPGPSPVPLTDDQVAELTSLNVRVVADPELGPRLEGDRHDTAFSI